MTNTVLMTLCVGCDKLDKTRTYRRTLPDTAHVTGRGPCTECGKTKATLVIPMPVEVTT